LGRFGDDRLAAQLLERLVQLARHLAEALNEFVVRNLTGRRRWSSW